MAKETGSIRWFNDAKGYGFIEQDNGEGDVFIHQSNIKMEGHRCLNDGDRVEYDVEENAKGFVALNVEKLTNE